MTDDVANLIRNLDEDDALLVLAHVTDRLRSRLDEDTLQSVQTEEDARALLTAANARIQGASNPWPGAPAHHDVVALLDWAASDPASGEVVRELVTRVPASRQLALGELAADPLLLGALVTLLQTRFRIRITSKDGKRSYDVEIGKEAADASVIGSVISRVLVKRP
jgi:hypothetical protein